MIIKAYKSVTKRMVELDKEMIEGLKGIGFKHDIGEDETGHQMKYFRRGGGYNLDAGSSALMIKGELGLLQYDRIERFTADGALLKDGSTVPADLIVLATGYYPQMELVRRALGEEMVERIGPVWGIGRGWRTQQHVQAHAAGRPVVHCRRSGPVPHQLEVSGPADQGDGTWEARAALRRVTSVGAAQHGSGCFQPDTRVPRGSSTVAMASSEREAEWMQIPPPIHHQCALSKCFASETLGSAEWSIWALSSPRADGLKVGYPPRVPLQTPWVHTASPAACPLAVANSISCGARASPTATTVNPRRA